LEFDLIAFDWGQLTVVPTLDFEGIASRNGINFDPSKLPLLENVFERVCKEAGIFADAKSETEALAIQLLKTLLVTPDEHQLVETGHSTVRRIRQKNF
jgi:hypothetical protein